MPALYRATPINAKFDWDNVPPSSSIETRTSTGWSPRAPLQQARRRRSSSRGFAPRTSSSGTETDPVGRAGRTLLEPLNPGAPLDCTDPGEARLRKLDGTATVIHGPAGDRQRSGSPSPEITQSKPAQQRLYLTPGRWDISIQYASTQELRVTASGGALAAPFDATLRTNLLFRGPSPYYPVGSLEVRRPGRGPSSRSASIDPPSVGRLLGTESRAYLAGLAATRSDPARQAVPLRGACGRYVDWYGSPRARRRARSTECRPRTRSRWSPTERPREPGPTTIAACPASGCVSLVILVACLIASMVIAIVKLS